MGSCWCGDCTCEVYEDGTIRYTGLEEWQGSVRRPFLWAAEPLRPYGSQLSISDYVRARQAQFFSSFSKEAAEESRTFNNQLVVEDLLATPEEEWPTPPVLFTAFRDSLKGRHDQTAIQIAQAMGTPWAGHARSWAHPFCCPCDQAGSEKYLRAWDRYHIDWP